MTSALIISTSVAKTDSLTLSALHTGFNMKLKKTLAINWNSGYSYTPYTYSMRFNSFSDDYGFRHYMIT